MSVHFDTIKRAFLGALALTSSCLFSSAALAQSTQEADIQLIKGDAVRISNIDDWVIGIYEPTDFETGLIYEWDWQCVHSSTGLFRFTVDSSNGGARLHLLNGANDDLNYRLYAYFRRNGAFTMRNTINTTWTQTNITGSLQVDCSDVATSATNLWFAAVVAPLDFNLAPPGIYLDNVTIMVAPE